MHIDKFLEVSDAQAVTATAPSADVIDTKQLRPNLGMSDLELVVTLAETATAAGAATVAVTLQDSPDNAVWRDIASKTLTIADMKVGASHVLGIPHQTQRYLRVNYTVATGPLTAGKFNAAIVNKAQAWMAHADSPNVV